VPVVASRAGQFVAVIISDLQGIKSDEWLRVPSIGGFSIGGLSFPTAPIENHWHVTAVSTPLPAEQIHYRRSRRVALRFAASANGGKTQSWPR